MMNIAPRILPSCSAPHRPGAQYSDYHQQQQLVLSISTRHHWRPFAQQQKKKKMMMMRCRRTSSVASRCVGGGYGGAGGGGDGLYGVLGVEEGVSVEGIKRAYRRLARKYHPDVHAWRTKSWSSSASADEEEREALTRKFMEAHQAYEVLSDPVTRAHYDHLLLRLRRNHHHNNNMNMNMMMGGGGASVVFRRRRRSTTTTSVFVSAAAAAVSAVWKIQWESQLLHLRKNRSWRSRDHMRSQHY